jgi:hypothetical protein
LRWTSSSAAFTRASFSCVPASQACGDVGMRRGLPGLPPAPPRRRALPASPSRFACASAAGAKAAIGGEGLLFQLRRAGRVRLLLGGRERERRARRAGRGQRQRLAPVPRAQRQHLALLAQPGGAGLHRLGLLRQALRGGPVLALHRLAQQAAQAEEARIGPLGQRLEGGRAAPRAPRAAPPRRQQQRLRRVAQHLARAAHLDARGLRPCRRPAPPARASPRRRPRRGGGRPRGAAPRRHAAKPAQQAQQPVQQQEPTASSVTATGKVTPIQVSPTSISTRPPVLASHEAGR